MDNDKVPVPLTPDEVAALMQRAGRFKHLKGSREAFKRARKDLATVDDGMYAPSDSKMATVAFAYVRALTRLRRALEEAEKTA